jgi:hypothetical protein|tara:strand:+ start:373 stop:969 length:597 start_codon:yes stop_codon:yes gene_type:complete
MLGLGAYDDSDEEEEKPSSGAPSVGGIFPSLLTAQAAADDDDSSDDESDDDSSDDESAPSVAAPAAAASEEAVQSQALPSIDEVLDSVETPSFLTKPKAEIEHLAFDTKAAEVKAAEAQQQAAAKREAATEAASHAAGLPIMKAASTVREAPVGQEDKTRESLKDRTKEKRKRDQSASFLGGRWKTEEEMHMRDFFDA